MKVSSILASVILILASIASAKAAGDDETANEPVTFTEHIAPIVFENCSVCHRPGQGTPFELLTYKDVKKRGQIIQTVIAGGTMPPWPPAEGWGHFEDERRLTDAQIDLIDRWVESGMPEGPADRLPTLPDFPDGWRLGEPDMIVTMPEAFDVPADGPDIYRMFVLPLDIAEDRWVTAVEIRPSAPSVVHHAIFFLDSTGATRALDAQEPGPGFSRMGFPRTGVLGGWAVGATPRHLPMGLGYPLAQGSDLVLQMHFHPSGKPEREQTTLGLYFARQTPPKKLLGMQTPLAFGLGTELRTRGIKAGEKDFTIHGRWEVPFDIELVSVGGHAHYLCTTMKAVAKLPDGKELNLFAIDHWDFNWQGRYNYAAPLRLPKGAVITTTLTYDNSADNPRNPNHPPIDVYWGEASTDEMGAISFAFVAVDESDIASYQGTSIFFGAERPNPAALRARLAALNLDRQQLRQRFDRLDANGNGKLEPDEVPLRLRPFVGRADSDNDGSIDLAELITSFRRMATGPAPEPDREEAASPETESDPESETTPADPATNDPPAGDTLSYTDLDGRNWTPLAPTSKSKANVLLFVAHDCPVSNQFAPEIGRLAREYSDRGVPFLLIHIDPDLTLEEARQHAKEYRLDDLPILLDHAHRLVARTGATITPEAAVVTPDGSIAYLGRIDDRFGILGRQRPEPTTRDLREALDAILSGRPVPQSRTEAIGCPIPALD